MRTLVVAVTLLATTAAHAGEPDTHDGGWDPGAKAALAGGVTFSFVYSSTAIATVAGDGLCGLGEHGDSCANPHTNLYVPLVGGLLPGRDDWSRGIGIVSSILQIGATGVMIAGLAAHHWHVKARLAAR